ncbi:MAG: pilin [Candidatus Magasanikbacteria bacterium]|nr:pilin [Candidatus Magasanikbacteria bacterium]
MRYLKQIFVFFLLFSCFAVIVPAALATSTPQETVDLENPIQLTDSKGKALKDADITPAVIIGTVIRSFLGLVGGLSLVMMVWGGFQWLTSAGNEEKVKRGTQTMMWSIIGLIVVLASYLLVNTVFRFLQGAQS